MKRLKYLLILVLFVSLFYSVPISFAKFRAVKSLEGTIVVPENNYCLNNNINTLSDCMLVMDNYSDSVSSAKTAIQAKGTPDFSKIAPQVNYRESGFLSSADTFNSSDLIYVADSYSFATNSGVYTLVNPSQIEIDANMNSYIGKYTCASTSNSTCDTIYKILDDSNDGTNYSITSVTKNTPIIYEVFDSDNGLYAANDDLGTSYYYRGSVKNNFVEFAGKYWRIVRRNGDGTIRLVYFSNTDTTTGTNAFKTMFNDCYDPTFEGFMHNEDDFSTTDIISDIMPYKYYTETNTYYFGTGYEYDTSTGYYHLTGSVLTGEIKAGIWKDDNTSLLNDGYYYTCFSNSEAGKCRVMKKIVSYLSSTKISVQMISRGSTSYENAIKNNNKSILLTRLESWYLSNISGNDSSNNPFVDYIADSIFCNDRGIDGHANNGNGYSLSKDIWYNATSRLSIFSPSFSCSSNDSFSLTTSNIGNKKLLYSVGILSADEYAFAGGVQYKGNRLYYLNYGDYTSLWTLSPSYYDSENGVPHWWNMRPGGSLYAYSWICTDLYVRPVINLKSTVKITGGDGTASNPYTLSL